MRFMAKARSREWTQCPRSGHREYFRSEATALQVLPHDLDSGRKEVAGAALGFYERRLSVVGLDLLAQPSYLHVDPARRRSAASHKNRARRRLPLYGRCR